MRTTTPDVELRVPADGSYLSVLRTTTAGLAARLDYTLDDIEELRVAVDEATALLLPLARPGTQLDCHFWLDPRELSVRVTTVSDHPRHPDTDDIAWTVLRALAHHVHAEADATHTSVLLTKRRGVRG